MKTYLAKRVSGDITLDGCVSCEPWSQIEALEIDSLPWHNGGEKQTTHVKACYDGNSLHVLFDCEDTPTNIEDGITKVRGP